MADHEATSDAIEKAYTVGQRMSLQRVICHCLRELGYDDTNPVSELARLVAQRESAVSALRRACAAFGDNDWPDDLALEGAIEKHLARPMQQVADEARRYRYCKWVDSAQLVLLAWRSRRACDYHGGDVDVALDLAIEDTEFERKA